MKRSTDRSIQNTAPLPAIRLGAREHEGRAHRGVWLVVYMRIVALLWIMQGLAQWADLLLDPTGDAFSALTPQRVAAVFFFCVLDFIAAVGLWLATPWGGVVWLVTVGAQLLSLVLLPGFWSQAGLLAISDATLVALYLALAWFASLDDRAKT